MQDALAATDDNRERIHGVLSAYFGFVDRDGSDGAFRLIFETDLGNEPAVRARVEAVSEQTMKAVADTVAGDTGLDRASAELLSTALTGAAQVAARWWLDRDRPITQAQAISPARVAAVAGHLELPAPRRTSARAPARLSATESPGHTI